MQYNATHACICLQVCMHSKESKEDFIWSIKIHWNKWFLSPFFTKIWNLKRRKEIFEKYIQKINNESK